SSHCREVRVVDAFTHPDEEYPFHEVRKFEQVWASLRAGGSPPRRVAVAGAEFISQKLWNALSAVSKAILVDGDSLIMGLRAMKSASEIAVIREAYRIAEAGTKAALAAVRPGVSERDIAAEAEYAMRRMGSEGMGIDTIVGSGRDNTYAILTRTTQRKIGPGDHVLLTIAPRYEGYHGAIGRVAAVGAV